jgi:hypothetical protein
VALYFATKYKAVKVRDIRGCNQKFPDWPPAARTANSTALRHYVPSEFCCHNPLCRFSTSVYYCCCSFRYRFSPETFGNSLVLAGYSCHKVSKTLYIYAKWRQRVSHLFNWIIKFLREKSTSIFEFNNPFFKMLLQSGEHLWGDSLTCKQTEDVWERGAEENIRSLRRAERNRLQTIAQRRDP